jgi:hypothetical protein
VAHSFFGGSQGSTKGHQRTFRPEPPRRRYIEHTWVATLTMPSDLFPMQQPG